MTDLTVEARNCGICQESNLLAVWDLPNLPLTETYGPFSKNYPSFDQSVQACAKCGHFQLGSRVSPEFLYSSENYSFKSLGMKRDAEEQLFIRFISEHVNLESKLILEFGANDLSLARKLSKGGNKVFAVDPLVESFEVEPEISAFPVMIEEFLDQTVETFDLIVARHTMEHIDRPLELVERLLSRLTSGGVIVFEFPSLDRIVSSLRGDAFFHQHYHYYDLASVRQLALGLGAGIVGFWQNRQGSNGGSLMVALSGGAKSEKGWVANASHCVAFGSFEPADRFEAFGRFRDLFINQMTILGFLIETNSPVLGIGAGLMTPVLDYHLGGRIGDLPMILDDDISKHGGGYRNLNTTIQHPDLVSIPAGFTALVTSLENPKPIFSRAIQLGAEKVLGLPVS